MENYELNLYLLGMFIFCLGVTFQSVWHLPVHPSDPANPVPYIFLFLKKEGFDLCFKSIEFDQCAAYLVSVLYD